MAGAPSYDGYTPSSLRASRVKARVRSTDTKPELLLRRELWSRGLRYRLHPPEVYGKPDLAFLGRRVAVFVDGDFWHGRDWCNLEPKLRKRANSEYWIAKIKYNRDRDVAVTRRLESDGWSVLRFWEHEVLQDCAGVSDAIEDAVG